MIFVSINDFNALVP